MDYILGLLAEEGEGVELTLKVTLPGQVRSANGMLSATTVTHSITERDLKPSVFYLECR